MQRVVIRTRLNNMIVALVFIILLIYCRTALAQDGLVKIADNVYSYVDVTKSGPQNSYGANAGIIIGRDGIVVVDTLISSKNALKFIEDIRSISDKPIKYVINTHYHIDHTFGNCEFKKLGAIIISHTNDKDNMENYGEIELKNIQNFRLTENDIEGTTLACPVLSFNDKIEIDLGDQRVELIYPGPSHSSGSIMVYLPDKKVLFTGDILVTDYHPFLGEGDINGWIKALDFIMTLDVTTLIPGHGPISTKKDVQDMKEYLLAFDEEALWLCAHSKDADFITTSIKKLLPKRSEGDIFIKPSIEIKYLKTATMINLNQ